MLKTINIIKQKKLNMFNGNNIIETRRKRHDLCQRAATNKTAIFYYEDRKERHIGSTTAYSLKTPS